ncbi:Caveolin-2 [Eumeta japonica]|uniref:Caveolin n=1 Tax=Eumeta variegata TaxID=151549 RepID=A0A4C1VJJ8_EUMVA|nr:Caveolin-2 [Eumeta japonica]
MRSRDWSRIGPPLEKTFAPSSTLVPSGGTVAFEDVPLPGSGYEPRPRVVRTSSRQCIACAHKAQQAGPGAPVLRAAPEMPNKPESVAEEALEDRDPNNLNQHLQIVWDDIIGEPEGARSPECAWWLSHGCFRHARNLCYTLLSVLLAPPLALLLGCGFACLAFETSHYVARFLSIEYVMRDIEYVMEDGLMEGSQVDHSRALPLKISYLLPDHLVNVR